MPRSSTVRTVAKRSWGSHTSLLDEVSVPFTMYHSGRGLRALIRTWPGRVVAGFVGLTVLAGWRLAVTLILLVTCGGLATWFTLRRRAEGASFTARDAKDELQHKAQLDKQWPLACEKAGIVGLRTGKPPHLYRVRGIGGGSVKAELRCGRIGVPVPDVQRATVTLSEVIGCREVAVTPTGPGRATITYHWRDPMGRVLPLAHLPAPITGQLAYGIRPNGKPATIKRSQSVLIGGLTRHGKSNIVWALLADANRQGVPVRLYVSDPKGGVELQALANAGGVKLQIAEYAKTPAETLKMIERFEKAMHAREYWMSQNGVREIELSLSNPLCVLILDETLPLTDILKKGTDSALGRAAYTGSAAGYVVWANAQVAQIDAIGRFRDLIPQRICVATSSPDVTDAVLRRGAEAQGARCSMIREPGVGYSHEEGEPALERFRAAYVTDAETRLIATGRVPDRMLEVEREVKGQTALYRWWPADAQEGDPPAYIGITYDPLRREAQHNADLREFMNGNVKRTVEWFGTRKAAEAAERQAILTEHPKYNIQHNGSSRRRRSRTEVTA